MGFLYSNCINLFDNDYYKTKNWAGPIKYIVETEVKMNKKEHFETKVHFYKSANHLNPLR